MHTDERITKLAADVAKVDPRDWYMVFGVKTQSADQNYSLE